MLFREPLPDDWVPRYLRMLGLEREAPSRAALARLTRAQVLAVPFGNITALLRYAAHGEAVPPLDLDALLTGWERGTGTAVCFEGTEAFGRLLGALGYAARPVPGFIAGFVGGHQGLLVTLDGAHYLADVANGAPFFDPVPLAEMVEVRHAGLAYRFRPGEEADTHVQDRWIAGAWAPFATYYLREQGQAERAGYYRRHHIPRESFVVGELRLVRTTPDAVISLRDTELSIFTAAGKRTAQLPGGEDFERAARDHFGLPALPLAAARAVLADLG
jgi:arylamine N-acetyltransferase